MEKMVLFVLLTFPLVSLEVAFPDEPSEWLVGSPCEGLLGAWYLVVTVALQSTVDWLEKHKVPRKMCR